MRVRRRRWRPGRGRHRGDIDRVARGGENRASAVEVGRLAAQPPERAWRFLPRAFHDGGHARWRVLGCAWSGGADMGSSGVARGCGGGVGVGAGGGHRRSLGMGRAARLGWHDPRGRSRWAGDGAEPGTNQIM
jgi:hypothetical protein